MGLPYWQPIIGTDTSRWKMSPGVRILVTFIGMPFEAFLGISIYMTDQPIDPINSLENTRAGQAFWILAMAASAVCIAAIAIRCYEQMERQTGREDRRAEAQAHSSREDAARLGVTPINAGCPTQLLSPSVVGMADTPSGSGYWIASATGAVAACGEAKPLGGIANPASPIVAIAAAGSGQGYWLVDATGRVYPFGSAAYHGGITTALAKPIVAIAADPATGGYWLLGADGGVFAFDAGFYGSAASLDLVQPAVGIAPAPSGHGYWLVAADGGVFAYGDAGFNGSLPAVLPPGRHLDAPVVGMAADPATGGYWLDAVDGGIFSFGAPFHGSAGDIHLDQPCVGMTATPHGGGYRSVAADGGIFDYGTAGFHGSAAQ